jgi:hypothetical protein
VSLGGFHRQLWSFRCWFRASQRQLASGRIKQNAADIQLCRAWERGAGGLYKLHRELFYRSAAGGRAGRLGGRLSTACALVAAPATRYGVDLEFGQAANSLPRTFSCIDHWPCALAAALPPPACGDFACVQALEKGAQGANAKFTYSCDGHSKWAADFRACTATHLPLQPDSCCAPTHAAFNYLSSNGYSESAARLLYHPS